MMRTTAVRRIGASIGGLGALFFALPAHATTGLDVPDSGALQVGRAGAWVARADDPIAAYMNPAAMSFQPSGISASVHLMIFEGCFARRGPGNEPVSPGSNLPGPGAEGGPEDVCATGIFPNPQLAGIIKATDELAIGLALVPPHAVGNVAWPETVEYERNGQVRNQPAPNRYLVTDQNALLIFPTISVSYAITPEFAVGAGFIWGIGTADFTTFTEALSPNAQDDFYAHQDVKANFTAADLFIPGFILGVDWRAGDYFDLGAWYRWSDSLRGASSLTLTSLYFKQAGEVNDSPCAGQAADCNKTEAPDAGTLEFAIPMEAKLGVRFHYPRAGAKEVPDWAKGKKNIKDPLSQELFDIEANLTWAHNSALESIEIRFKEGIAVKGTPGSVPVNGDIPHNWKDVLGIRLGGDVNIIENLLALRAGGFFESKGVDDEYLNLDFHAGFKAGVSGGGTVRLGPVDLHLAYQHVFYGTLDNGGEGQVKALSGDATTDFRSRQAVNGGSYSASLNEVVLGGSVRF
jgi:long-subunit fatty acid transport protein